MLFGKYNKRYLGVFLLLVMLGCSPQSDNTQVFDEPAGNTDSTTPTNENLWETEEVTELWESVMNVYEIENWRQLEYISNQHSDDETIMGADFVLVNDIYFPSRTDVPEEHEFSFYVLRGFVPIGTISTPFTGTFDGQNNKIIDIEIENRDSDAVGLFSHIDGDTASVSNILIKNSKIYGRNETGTLAGCISTGVHIENVRVDTGHVEGDNSTGGLVGVTESGTTILDGYFEGLVMGVNSVGGILGDVSLTDSVSGTIIDNSHAQITIEASGDSVGGLIGRSNSANITNSSAMGTLEGKSSIGGLIGDLYGGSVLDSHADVDVDGSKSTRVGGLIGQAQDALISESYAVGDVDGGTETGGLIGAAQAGNVIEKTHTSGFVQGSSLVGGLIGTSNSPIRESYTYGDVTGTEHSVGGLVGINQSIGSIENSYASGYVSGVTSVGGLIGEYHGVFEFGKDHGIIRNSYFVGAVSNYKDTNSLMPNSSGAIIGLYNATNLDALQYVYWARSAVEVFPITFDHVRSSEAIGKNLSNTPPSSNQIYSVNLDIYIISDNGVYRDSSTNGQIFVGWDFSNVWQWNGEKSWPTLTQTHMP